MNGRLRNMMDEKINILLEIIMDEYLSFETKGSTDEKLESLCDIVFGLFLYLVMKNDYKNYQQVIEYIRNKRG
jgi:hypothetical protein